MKLRVPRQAFLRAEGTLAATLQVSFQSLLHEAVDLAERLAGIAVSPGSPMAAMIRCFTTDAGFTQSEGLAAPIGVTRLFWVRSSLRLAPSPPEAPCEDRSCNMPGQLHG